MAIILRLLFSCSRGFCQIKTSRMCRDKISNEKIIGFWVRKSYNIWQVWRVKLEISNLKKWNHSAKEETLTALMKTSFLRDKTRKRSASLKVCTKIRSQLTSNLLIKTQMPKLKSSSWMVVLFKICKTCSQRSKSRIWRAEQLFTNQDLQGRQVRCLKMEVQLFYP